MIGTIAVAGLGVGAILAAAWVGWRGGYHAGYEEARGDAFLAFHMRERERDADLPRPGDVAWTELALYGADQVERMTRGDEWTEGELREAWGK